MELSDHELLRRLRKGNSAAAEALWRRHAPRLTIYARAILHRSGESAEDAVQGVFCAIIATPRREARAIDDVAAWLTRLTRNAALNAIRAARRERARRDVRAGGRAPHAVGATVAGDPALADAIDALPRRLREVIVLKDLGGLTFDQLALALGVPRTTAASRHHAARSALTRALDSNAPRESATMARGQAARPRHQRSMEVGHAG